MPAPVECGREDLNLQQQPSQDCASAGCATSARFNGEIQTRNPGIGDLRSRGTLILNRGPGVRTLKRRRSVVFKTTALPIRLALYSFVMTFHLLLLWYLAKARLFVILPVAYK